MFILKILKIEAKRSNLILKCESSEAKPTGSLKILYLKSRKKANFRFFLKTTGKKRKCSILNYRSFVIPSTVNPEIWIRNPDLQD
jgi:hypothetical protein